MLQINTHNMKKLIIPAAVLFLAASCTQENKPVMSESDMQRKTDSLAAEKMNGMVEQANEELDRRIAIEVKPKADSIVAAAKNK